MKFVIYGSDVEQIGWQARNITRSEQADEITHLDASVHDKQDIVMAMDSISLFEQKDLVFIDKSTFLGSKNTSKIKPEDLIPYMDTSSTVVFLCPGFKPDTRKKAVKTLLEQCTLIECRPLDEKSQPGWIKEQIAKRKIDISKEALEWLFKHAGLNIPKLDNDLETLSLFGSRVELEDVKALVSAEKTQNIFKMSDALFEKNADALLYYFRLFRQQNMDVPAIIGLLASQIRFVYQVKVLSSLQMPKAEMEQKLGASSGRIWMTQKNAARFSDRELLGHLSSLHKLDEAYKSGQIDKDDGFEMFVVNMLLEKEGRQPAFQFGNDSFQ